MKERQGIPHHLIDIVEPEFDYSVGNYYDDARKAIYDILSRGKLRLSQEVQDSTSEFCLKTTIFHA